MSTSLKIRLARRFLLALKNLYNTKPSPSHNNQIHQRSRQVKIAAYASMASVVGSRRAWSRAILWKLRNPRVLARNKMRVGPKFTLRRLLHHHRRHLGSETRRNPSPVPKRQPLDPVGNSGLEQKLRKLVPGAEKMDSCGLLDETADYIKYLATQMRFKVLWVRMNPKRTISGTVDRGCYRWYQSGTILICQQ